MPLDHSIMQKDNKVVLDHSEVKEGSVIKKDIRAPVIEFTFDLQKDSSKPEEIDQSVKMQYNKV